MIRILKRPLTRSALSALALAGWLLTGCNLPTADRVPETPELRFDHTENLTKAKTQWLEWLTRMQTAPVIMLGEQHDAPEHHAWEADTVRELTQRKRLAALVLEMADAGATTHGLPANASEADVQQALNWNDKAWPWESYGPSVMAAVRAEVPVLGGNLPRKQMADAMKNARFDQHLSAEAMQIQRDAIKQGHCNLLPETQLQPMARIQLARDESMAQIVRSAIEPGRTVLLIAGHGHVRSRVGVATWLPANLLAHKAIAQAGAVDSAIKYESNIFIVTPALPSKDHCAELRQHFKR
ncbi:ChaN family lipoprotein [Diaphorobacter sp. HDW4B]|uniref:ChaN family lipoprotein n=1 Tax=Diaphorobacter sp. HDW4B TaxID=2714925 RepID=UPI00140C3D3D|nr:ChaN family lipoprotein [Diaphorobacter sp. HDW4B]QIL70370.1 ChaN family lipoprotein [Diaphorobacter sp. HDW4B]